MLAQAQISSLIYGQVHDCARSRLLERRTAHESHAYQDWFCLLRKPLPAGGLWTRSDCHIGS
jgi:hypothetical protein